MPSCMPMSSYTTRANGIIVLSYIDQHGIFGTCCVVKQLSADFLLIHFRKTFSLFPPLLIGYEVIAYTSRGNNQIAQYSVFVYIIYICISIYMYTYTYAYAYAYAYAHIGI